MLPVAVNCTVPKLPTFALPVADTKPAVIKLPPVMLPVAVTMPPVPILPTFEFPVTDAVPVTNNALLE